METARPLETIIYGGAFNPPTLAHQAILQGCIDYAEPRQADVWLLPSASRRDKTIDAPRQRRLELCRALIADCLCGMVSVDIDTRELDRAAATETYDTVRQLEVAYPERAFTWVFGSDSLATMSEWSGGEWLRDTLRMLVVERPGHPIAELGRNAVRLAVAAGDLSSTEVRSRLALGMDCSDLVGTSVGILLER